MSYKAEDRPRLQSLVGALEAEGFTVGWDAHMGGGTNWRRDIEEHLDAAKCVVVAWTKRSVGGSEARAYLSRRRPSPSALALAVQAVALHTGTQARTNAHLRSAGTPKCH